MNNFILIMLINCSKDKKYRIKSVTEINHDYYFYIALQSLRSINAFITRPNNKTVHKIVNIYYI